MMQQNVHSIFHFATSTISIRVVDRSYSKLDEIFSDLIKLFDRHGPSTWTMMCSTTMGGNVG